MNRRTFHSLATGALAAAAAPAQTTRTPRRNALMHVGGDYHSVAGATMTGRENLEYNLRYGVRHLTAKVTKLDSSGGWDFDELRTMRDNCDRMGVKLEAIRMEPTYIKLPTPNERDEELRRIHSNIEKAGKVGVEVITHHWTVIPIRRNLEKPGRGGSTYLGFRLEEDWQKLPVGPSGRVSSQEYWDRIGVFLEKTIPIAAQNNVKIACHPYDPPGLPYGYQGADNWDSPSISDAFKRYEEIVDSPYNGFQCCVGTIAEGLANPARDVAPIVEYLASRGKIHQVHMRNIQGRLHDFVEVFPDEGVLDYLPLLRILRDYGFAMSICPDHMPKHPHDPGSLQSFAFGYGYLGALIHAVNSEVQV
jgi:mannonate dehydratase